MEDFFWIAWIAVGLASTPGVDWDRWWLCMGLRICILMGMFVCIAPSPISDGRVPREAAELAPDQAIAAMMDDFEEQGYVVTHIWHLAQDRTNRNRVLIEYIVTTPDRRYGWVYKWAWEVPHAAAYSGRRHPEVSVEECRLIPLSQTARLVQETRDRYIEQTGEGQARIGR